MSIRKTVLDAFESAALVTDPEEKAKRCSFVVVGAGPTGLEFAAELSDCITEDFSALFPNEVPLSSVTIVSSSPDLLASYDKRVSEFTNSLIGESDVVLKLGKRVVAVEEDAVHIMDKKTKDLYKIPAAMTLWSTGVAPIGIVKDFIESVPEQTKRHGVYALGDCASVVSRGKEMLDTLKKAYEDKASTCERREELVLCKEEAMGLMDAIEKKFPSSKSFSQAAVYQARIRAILERDLEACDQGQVTYSDFQAALDDCYSSLRSLPPTAQVAGQQGSYLASLVNGETTEPFRYFHKGSMAYVGQNKAAAQVSMLKSFLPNALQKLPIVGEDVVLTGTLAAWVWKALYLDMQVSNKNKLQVAFDWIKVGLFGRCVSRY